MREKVTYINHIGEELVFGEGGIFVNSNDLHDFSWDFINENGAINSFKRGAKKKELPLVVVSENGIEVANKITEVTEKDILTQNTGKLIIGEYYLKCYITASKKSKYNKIKGFSHITLQISANDPVWTRENSYQFLKGGGIEGGTNLDYPHNLPYDFAPASALRNIENPAFADSDFKLIIYGPVTDPEITIKNHLYSVTGTVNENEHLIIDSKEKTVDLVDKNGEKNNWFSKRNKESYIFKKIPAGNISVNWDATIFGFDIVIYEERSEPKWT